MFKFLLCSLFAIFVFTSCNVSFPKETLEQDAVNLIKKETQVDTKAYVRGATLYLDVCFEDLVSNDQQKISKMYETLQKVVSNIVRVPLSSDAKIDYVVISAFDPNYQTLLRLVENIDDIKLYSHQLISREDYSERQLMEFEGPLNVKDIVNNKYDISKEEYVARLIGSQLNLSSRNNPLVSKLIQLLELKFSHIEDDKMFFKLKRTMDNDKVINLLKELFENEVNKNIQKYKLFSIKSAILLDEKKNTIFNVSLNV
ncbi:MAG: hypothetical protein IKN42_07490 [Elusimicrobia bacterium]|nr:hypothetical protein [Elusimicrobiota bacterium]